LPLARVNRAAKLDIGDLDEVLWSLSAELT
jgi:hypothetical protein